MTPPKQFQTVGFTGSRKGMSAKQKEGVLSAIIAMKPSMVRHGDCVGSDADFHTLCALPGIVRTIHPPSDNTFRAWCAGEVTLPCKDYITRNHDIVNASDVLIATPQKMVDELRSGTWATVRYAEKIGKPCCVVFPDGSLSWR